MKSLPVKYYLDHFKEFTAYLLGTCGHLLSDSEHEYIQCVEQLPENAQCLLVRIFNRQSIYVRRDSLQYAEINDSEGALQDLLTQDFLRQAQHDDWPSLLIQLNKTELQSVVSHSGAGQKSPVKSARKACWQAYAESEIGYPAAQSWLHQHYIVQAQSQRMEYFLFLYFGTTRARLNQLSMRDLGIMRTRRLQHQVQARFANRDEAQSCFLFQYLNTQLKVTPDAELSGLIAQAPVEPTGLQAHEAKDMFYEQLGRRVLSSTLAEHDDNLALAYLQKSAAPGAIEKRLRHQYAAGQVEEVREALEQLIDDPPNDTLLIFAEDFYARKFNRKRTSVLTDMLRQSGAPLALDEAYMGSVESGVQAHYQRQGLCAFRTENRLWRALFGLVFWAELFENPKAGTCTEFDRLPPVLKANQFYTQLGAEIEARLSGFTGQDVLYRYLVRVSAEQYGKPNGLFRWHSKMLEVLHLLTSRASLQSLFEVLRAMAQDYHSLSDGFPDLMVIDEDGLRFEEIKAPGDSLRRNQLISMQMLKRTGFNVKVQMVEWQFNPQQDYVVIDVETTGGNHSGHRVTEVGMVKVRQGVIVDRWQSLINPQRHIPQRITELTGISNEMVKDAPVFSDVLDQIDEFMRGSIFVAHNVNFDYGFIKREYERCARSLRLPKQCTVRLARQYFPGQVSYSLGKLCKSLDITLHRHHRALDDAEAAAGILLKVQQKRLQGS